METKEVILFCELFMLSIFFVSLIEAEKVGMSKYDGEILRQFQMSKWVSVIIGVKDFSNVTIDYEKDSVEIQTEKDKLRWGVYKNTSDSVLSTLLEDEFVLERKSEFGVFFSGNITREGFEKLLEDERVQNINIKKGGSLHGLTNIATPKNILIFFLSLVLTVILITLIFKSRKKRKWE